MKTILYRTMLHHTDRLLSPVTPQPRKKQPGGDDTMGGLMLEYGSPSENGSDREPSTTPSPRPTNEELTKSLRNLVKLFDEVLMEEYAPCHNELQRVIKSNDSSGWSVATEASTSRKLVLIPPNNSRERTEKLRVSACNFACDFCGADIFQSFFECRTCSGSPTEWTQPGDGFLICSACYVEGRSCACDEMEPMQCRPLQVLIDDRNRAASACRQFGASATGETLQDLRERCVALAKNLWVISSVLQ